MASNVITLNTRNTKAPAKDRAANNCVSAVIASFGQAKALRDLPRHLKAGAL